MALASYRLGCDLVAVDACMQISGKVPTHRDSSAFCVKRKMHGKTILLNLASITHRTFEIAMTLRGDEVTQTGA